MKFRLDSKHYLFDHELEAGTEIGDGTDFHNLPEGFAPSASMTPLDQEALELIKKMKRERPYWSSTPEDQLALGPEKPAKPAPPFPANPGKNFGPGSAETADADAKSILDAQKANEAALRPRTGPNAPSGIHPTPPSTQATPNVQPGGGGKAPLPNPHPAATHTPRLDGKPIDQTPKTEPPKFKE